MIQLIFTVCSLVQGAKCHQLPPIPLEDGTGMIGCAIAGLQEGAKYTIGHPNYYIAKFTCQPAGLFARS